MPIQQEREHRTYINHCTRILGLVLIRLPTSSPSLWAGLGIADVFCLSHWFHLESHWLPGVVGYPNENHYQLRKRKHMQDGNFNSNKDKQSKQTRNTLPMSL